MKTKTLTAPLVAILLLAASCLRAQDETQTLFGDARVVGGFGGPIFEFGNLNDQYGSNAGGGGAVVFRQFFLGGFGMGSTDYATTEYKGDEYEIDLGYGGFWLGYTPLTQKVIHPYASLRIGWGDVELVIPDSDEVAFEDNVFCLVPEIGLELNIFRWFRISAAGGYRYVAGASGLPDGVIDSQDLRSFCGFLTLRFGGFGRSGSNDND